jgi:hypothetical protein
MIKQLLFAGVLGLWVGASAVAAPRHPAPEVAKAPTAFDHAAHIAQLEGGLAQRDYKALQATLAKPSSANEVQVNLDWLGTKFQHGESVVVAFNYARLLSEVARSLPTEQAQGIRGTALAAWLYATTVAQIEGQQCGDATARLNRTEQLARLLGQSDLLQLDEITRQQAALIALAIERKTWSQRRTLDDSRFLCANGMAAIAAGLRAGAAREEKPRPGQFGRQIVVTPPVDFKYTRLDNQAWWPKAEELRSKLPDALKVYAKIDTIPSIESVEGNSR